MKFKFIRFVALLLIPSLILDQVTAAAVSPRIPNSLIRAYGPAYRQTGFGARNYFEEQAIPARFLSEWQPEDRDKGAKLRLLGLEAPERAASAAGVLAAGYELFSWIRTLSDSHLLRAINGPSLAFWTVALVAVAVLIGPAVLAVSYIRIGAQNRLVTEQTRVAAGHYQERLYEVKPEAVQRNGRIVSSDLKIQAKMAAPSSWDLSNLSQSLRLYQELQSDESLMPLMPPLRRGLFVVDGTWTAPAYTERDPKTNSERRIPGLQRRLISGTLSRYTAVFYLRRAMSTAERIPYRQAILNDADFLKHLLVKLESAPDEIRRLRADLEAASVHWRSEAGYPALLQQLAAIQEDSRRQAVIDEYLADRLAHSDLEPIWGVTFTPNVYRALAARRPADPRNPFEFLNSLCFSACLTLAGIRKPEAREEIAKYFYRADTYFLDEMAPNQRKRFQDRLKSRDADEQVRKRRTASLIKSATQIWAELNPDFGLGSAHRPGIQEAAPFLFRQAQDLLSLWEEADRPQAKVVAAEVAVERLYHQMEGALASEPEDRLKSQVTSVLEAQHGSVRTVSLLLASIAYRRPALLPACERLARAFTGQGLYARFSIERTRAHLHSDLEALLKQAMEKTDQDAPPLKAGWPGRYSPLERLEILQSARRAQKGYEGSLRKDLRRPYVDHIVRAIRELVERFDRLSAMGLVVGLWHDMDEENPTFYREQMQALYEEAKTDRERFQFHYLRLGVRMLTRDALPPPLAEDRQAQEAHEARYIEGLVHPGTVYGELAQFKNLTWLFDDKEFQRQIQLVKCVDTLANWGDFPYFFNAEVRLTDQLQELPSKLFNKALRGIIPGMINHPDCRLSQEDTERFYSGMMEKLRSYTALSGARNPQALELRRAAAAAIPELKERIRQNTRFYSDQPGKGSDILRGLVEEHPENVMAAYEEAVAETRKIGRTNTPVAAPGHFQEDGALKEKGGLGIVGDLSPEVKARLKRLQDRLIELLQARNAKLLGKMWFPDVDHLTIAGLAMEEGFNASQAQNWELVGQACRRAGQVSRFTPQAEATIGNVLRFPFTIAVDVTPDSEQDLETLDGLQTAFGHLVRVLPKYIYHLSIAWIPTHGILETSEADDLNAVLDQLFEEILSDPLGHLTLDAIDVKSFTRLDREQTSHSGIIALRQPSDFKSQIKVGRRILARILGLADAWQLSRPVYQAIVIALLSAFPNLYLQRDAALFAAIGGKVIGEEDEAAIRHKFERRGRFQVFIKSSPAGGEVPLQVEMPSRRLSNLKAILEAIQRSGGDIGALSVPAAGNGGPSVTVTALANRLDTPKADGLIEMLKNLADLPPDESVEARDEVEMKVEIPSGLKPFMTLMEKVLAHEPQIWVESLDLRPWLSDPRKSTLNLKVQIRSGGGERVRKVIGFRSTELMPIPLQTPAGGHGKGAQERVLQQEA